MTLSRTVTPDPGVGMLVVDVRDLNSGGIGTLRIAAAQLKSTGAVAEAVVAGARRFAKQSGMHAATGAEAPSRLPAGLSVTGDLSSDQDLVIDGTFDGQITLPDQQVTINPSARVKGRIVARAVTIAGAFEGTVIATGRVSLAGSASVRAHLQTTSIVMNEGARFDGSVDPNRTEAATHVAKYRQKQAEGA